MNETTQHGYLLLADISGYTSFVAATELDHSHEILSDLLETICMQIEKLLTIHKLEGDAVFALLPKPKLGVAKRCSSWSKQPTLPSATARRT
jgi:hypothetical protein